MSPDFNVEIGWCPMTFSIRIIRPTLKMGAKGGQTYMEYCARFPLMKLTSNIGNFDNNFGGPCSSVSAAIYVSLPMLTWFPVL